jgi:penicillin-binding protein 1C
MRNHNKLKIFILILAGILLVYFLIPLPDPVFINDYSTVVLDQDDQILRVFLNNEEQWCFPPNPNLQIPDKLKITVLQYEDKYFYWHPGINTFSVFRALYQNITSGHIESGASTITMQVARLINRQPRTYLNKMLEMLQTIKIEILYSKDEILQLYLDHAPYGGNIIGYQAAALRYFHRLPDNLTWGQAATLAVLPNAPGLISPQNDPQKLGKKRNQLLKRLLEDNIIDADIYKLACLEKVPKQSTPLGFSAPHLCRFLKNQENQPAIIKTGIEKKLQQQIEALVESHGEYLNTIGIKNTAALVVETQTGQVKAYVGSDDFFDTDSRGQVDGVRAPRSSGSILKPFLYALSMDEGYILPQSLIKDVPSFYGTFSPANADYKYRGMITAKEALVHSLNVPAVRLLYQYGYQSFYYFLKEAGLSTLFRHHEDYGLPLILGGAETSLWDMATLYRGLSLYGKFESIRLLRKKKENYTSGVQLISPGACYLTLNVLKELNRPGSEYYWQQYQNQWPLAWKTGTSYGQRDGWAIGVSPQWTIAVWAGNFDGLGNANLSGAACAGPILFDIFNTLPKIPELGWFVQLDMDLKEICLCRHSGFLAGDDCTENTVVYAPRFMKPMQICPFHKKIFVSDFSQEQVCSLCWFDTPYHTISKLIFPPDVSQYLRQNAQVVESVPIHNPSCPALAQGNPLQIVYPQQNAALWVPRDFGGELQKINCRVAHQQKNCRIYWYLDDLYQGISQEKHELALVLDKGWHELQVVDENGNSNLVRFYANLRE